MNETRLQPRSPSHSAERQKLGLLLCCRTSTECKPNTRPEMKQKANVIAMHRNSGRGKKTCIYTLQELLSLSDRLTATNIRLGQSVFSDSGPTPGVTPTHVPISSPALGPRGKLKARLSSKVNITTTSLPTSPEPCSLFRVEVRGGVGWRTCY